MALEPQNVEIRLGKRDGQSSDVLSAPGTLTRAENVIMVHPTELQRRPGGDFVVNFQTSAKRIASVGGELVSLDRANTGAADYLALNAVNPSTGSTLTTKLAIPAPAHTMPALSAAVVTDQRCHMSVTSGGYDWHIYETIFRNGFTDQNQIILDVYDSVTRARVHTRIVASSSASPIPTRPGIYIVGTNIIITYVEVLLGVANNEGSAQGLYAYKIPISNPATAALAVLVDTCYGAVEINTLPSPYDAQPVTGSTSTLGLAYRVPGAVFGFRFRVRGWNCNTMATSFTSSGNDIAATANGDLGGTALAFLHHNHSDNVFYFASVVSTNGGAARNNVGLHAAPSNGSSVVVDVVLNNSVNASWRAVTGFMDSSLKAWVMCESRVAGPAWPAPAANSTTGTDRFVQVYARTSGGVITAPTIVYGVGLASHPFVMANPNTYYIVYVASSSIAPTYFLASVLGNNAVPTPDQSGILGVAFQGSAGVVDADPLETGTLARLYTPQRNRLPLAQVSGSQVRVAASRMGANSSVAAPQREAWLIGFELTTGAVAPLNVSDELLIPIGSPILYDGANASASLGPQQATFQFVPEAISVVTNAAGGTLVPGDIYDYAYCYATKDVRNRLILSAPSPVLTKTIAVGFSGVTFNVYTNIDRTRNYAIYVFRSNKNAGTNAPLYFQRAINVNSLNNRTIPYTDLGADFDPGEQLYTLNGAILENAPFPPCSQLTVWKKRVWGVLDEFPNGYCFSKLLKQSYGLEYNDDFQDLIEDEYGRLYGIAPLDERLLFFKENAVYYLSGDGPDDGGKGEFSDPKRLDGVPGCTNPASVAVTGLGVFYQAPDKGIWLIRPSLESVFIGKSQLDITSATTNITGTLYEPNKQHVRFYNSATGVTLNYDIQHDMWSSFTQQQVLNAVMHNDLCTYLRTDQSVSKEDATGAIWTESRRSDTVTYQSLVELSWLSLGQVNGYMRTWVITLLGKLLGAHTLSLDLLADFGTTVTTRSLLSSALQTQHGYRVEAKVPITMQQNTAIRLRIKDNSPTTAGFALASLMLQCGFLPGKRPRLPATHRMG